MKLIFNTLIVTCNYLILEVNLNKDEIFYGCSVHENIDSLFY